MPTKQQHAIEYASIGWAVYACHNYVDGRCTCGQPDCKSAGKHPLAKSFDGQWIQPGGRNAATADTGEVEYRWGMYQEANIGVNTELSGLAVIDADIYKDDVDLSAVLQPEDYADTPHLRTGRGGLAIIFRAPEGDILPSSDRVLPGGVEFKAGKGSFNAPPSINAGGQYEWIVSPFDVDPKPLPRHIIDLMAAYAEEVAQAQQEAQEAQARRAESYNAPDVDLVREVLTYLDPSHWGDNTYSDWFKAVQAVYAAFAGQEDGEQKAIDVLSEWQPESASEFRSKVQSLRGGTTVNFGSIYYLIDRYPSGKSGRAPRPAPKHEDPFAGEAVAYQAIDAILALVAQPDAETKKEAEAPALRMPEFWDTDGYVISTDGRLCQRKERKEGDDTIITYDPIADFAATIVREFITEDGAAHYELKVDPVRGYTRTVEIAATDFGKRAALRAALEEAAGAMSAIHTGKDQHLQQAIKTLSNDVQTVTRYERIGWDKTGRRFLLPNRDFGDGIDLDLPVIVDSYGFSDDADLAIGLDALDKLMSAVDDAATTVLVASILASIISHPAGIQHRFGCFVKGQTGSLKTAVTKVAMGIIGDFSSESSFAKFGSGATPTALSTLASRVQDAPFFIDNFKPNTTEQNVFTSFIHMVMEGRERLRADRSGRGLQGSDIIRTTPVITGEDVPADDAATLARLVVVDFPKFSGDINDELSWAQANVRHLTAVGRALIEWLETDEGLEVAQRIGREIAMKSHEWTLALRNVDTQAVNMARVSYNLAVVELCWDIAKQCPAIGATLRRYDGALRKGLDRAATFLAMTTAESLEGTRFVKLLSSLIDTGQATTPNFYDGAGFESMSHAAKGTVVGWAGQYEDIDVVFVSYELAFSAIQKVHRDLLNNVSKQQITQQLVAAGIAVGNPATIRVPALGGKRRSLLPIRMSYLDGDIGGEVVEDANAALAAIL